MEQEKTKKISESLELSTGKMNGTIKQFRCKFPWVRKLRKLQNALHFEDVQQKRLFNYIVKFVAIMLIFTLIARGTSGATLSKVEFTVSRMGEIIESKETTGTVEAVLSVTPDVPENITIEKILVVPGEVVKADTKVAMLNAEELAAQSSDANIKLKEMELNLAKLQRGESYDSSTLTTAQTALEWTTQDVSTVAAAGQAAIENATNTLNKASEEYERAKSEYDRVLADAAATEDQKAIAAQALSAAQKSLEAATLGLSTAQTTASERNVAAARAQETARQTLTSAQQAENVERQKNQDVQAQNAIAAESLKISIAQQKKLISLYNNIPTDGVLLAGVDGTVLAIDEEKKKTGASFVLRISDATGGYQVTGKFSKSDANDLPIGANADISLKNGYFENSSKGRATLISMSNPDSDNMVTVTFRLSEANWKQGEVVTISVIQNRADYNNCVPLEAIHQSQQGYFIFVLEESTGVLGTENIVKMLPVKLLATDGTTAAIEGAFSSEDKIVVNATKAIADGDKVRVTEQ